MPIKEFFSYHFGGEVLRTLYNFFKETAGEKVKKELGARLPGFLGLSLEDERIFEALRSQLTEEEDQYLTKFLKSCKDYERNRFRNVVTGIPSEKEELKKGMEDKVISATIQTNNAVLFLKRIAYLTSLDPEKARERCLSSGTILEDPVQQKILREWRESVKWFKAKFLDVLGVSSLSEITMDYIEKKTKKITKDLKKIDKKFATKIPKVEDPGFFKGVFGFNLPRSKRKKEKGGKDE